METVAEEFNWSSDPKTLRAAYERTNYDKLFIKHITNDVIRLLSPKLPSVDEELVYLRLLKPLEEYVFGNDAKGALDLLTSFNQPRNLCRRLLKAGDVTFSCNDCGLDGTCVVCIDCFHKSAHKDHNYKMSNSEGGGCCDCGDIEAWKQNYACTDHMSDQKTPSLQNFQDRESRSKQIDADKQAIQEKLNKLPGSFVSKYFMVCQASLQYARKLLAWKNYTSPPSELEPDNPSCDKKNFFAVLYNDEVHTYDQVISTLVKLIKCTKMAASVTASVVSREGRALIVNDTLEYCKGIADSISSIRDGSSAPLRVEVIHCNLIAHQAFASRLIKWIQKMSGLSDAFRVITAYTLQGPDIDSNSDSSLVETIMLSNTDFWKSVRIEWNDLFVKTMLTDYSIKDQFARKLTQHYATLMRSFIRDDHDHNVSILTMTCQLYTVPSLIPMLIEEENALSIIISSLDETCRSTKRDNPSMNFENHNTFDMHGLKRGFYTISDLMYLINHKPLKWTTQLRRNVIEAAELFLDILNSMQGIDSVRRQLGQHLEYEPDWEPAMALQQRLTGLITRFVIFLSYDEEVLVSAVKMAQTKLLKKGSYKMVTKELFGHHVSCIQYDVSALPVSVHLPLTRFTAALTLELMSRRISERSPYDESLVVLVEPIDGRPKHSMIDLMELSLRTQVMVAQFRSGMWRRNGYSLVGQISYIHLPLLRKEMFDRDILMLQECAATCEANEFIIHLLNKFNLFTWIGSDTTREPLIGPKAVSFSNDDEIMNQTMSLGEEFLQLLITIVGERYQVAVGEVDKDDGIKNEIIQLLCIHPLTRSELSHSLCVYDNELDCIKAVATLKRSTQVESGKYELKEEYFSRFNPFFYHYSRKQQSDAIDSQLKRKKNLKNSLICCPPPKPVKLTKQFNNLNELLRCDITLILIQKILKRALGYPENYRECSTKASVWFTTSDLQLDQCLHLIGLGLYEQERNLTGFCYVQSAHEKDIFKLLVDCYQQAGRSKDFIIWLMRKTTDLIRIIESQTDELDARTREVIESIRGHFEPVSTACDTSNQDSKKHNSEQAANRRARILAKMKADQNKFITNSNQTDAIKIDEDPDSTKSNDSTHLCILCRDEQKIDFDKPTMVLLAYIQRSAVLSKNRRPIPHYTPIKNEVSLQYSYTSNNSLTFDASFMTSDLFFGPHISTCGHAMHHECWQGYFNAVVKRETGRPNRNSRHLSFDLEKNEILCPLCECISNATIPILPSHSPDTRSTPGPKIDLSAWLHSLKGCVDTPNLVRHMKPAHIGSSSLSQPEDLNKVLEDLREVEALGLRDFLTAIRSNRVTSNICSKSLLTSISTLSERIHHVGLDLDKSVTDADHSRTFMMTTWAVSYTVQSTERFARFKEIPIFHDLESSRNLSLRSLVRFACSSVLTHHSGMLQSFLVKKLRYLLVNEEYMTSPLSCLDIDVFETFISIMILLQKLYYHVDDFDQIFDAKLSCGTSKGVKSSNEDQSYAWTTGAFNHEYFKHLLHLMLILHLVQVIITIQNEISTNSSSVEEDTIEADGSVWKKPCPGKLMALESFYRAVILNSGHPNDKVPKIDDEFCCNIRNRLLPFLRSCAIFFHHLTQSKPPKILESKSALFEGREFLNPSEEVTEEFKDARQSLDVEMDWTSTNLEFDEICKYLNLPADFGHLLQSQEARHLAHSWLRHSRVLMLINQKTELKPMRLIRQPHSVNRLVDLPYDYSELVDRVSNFTCPSIKNEDSRTPTMCLVCNLMLCSQSFCCQRNQVAGNGSLLVGSCTYHAHECSAGVGVFLRIRTCQILLLSGTSKGCYMPAPYIDDHGETDYNLMRGNPLHLNELLYEKLQHMWLNHAIPEQVSRILENSTFGSSQPWHIH